MSFSYKMLRKLIRWGMPLGMLLFALATFNVAFANDGDLQVPTTAITASATLAQSAPVSYTLVNTANHAVYYSATMDPSPGRCSKGLETSFGGGEEKVIIGAIEARCYQQPGQYRHTLVIRQKKGSNDPNYNGQNEYRIPVTITVPSALQNFAWDGTMATQPIVVGTGDAFTTTITMKNLQNSLAIGQTRVRIYYEPTNGSFTPVITGDGSLAMDGQQDWMDLRWIDDLPPGETVTLTITSRGGPFVGAYPGSVVATLANGQEVAQGLVVVKPQAPLKYAADLNPYQVGEGSLFTITLSITNTTDFTQTTATTFTVGGGAVGEVVGIKATHGEFFGFSSGGGVWAAIFTAEDEAGLTWLLDIPPHTTAKLVAVVKASPVDAQIEFPGVFSWEIPDDVIVGSVSIFPVISLPTLRIDSVAPASVERGEKICLRGLFETLPGKVVIDWETPLKPLIELEPELWSKTMVCFGTKDLAGRSYGVRLQSGEYASNKMAFTITEKPAPADPNLLYLPLIQR